MSKQSDLLTAFEEYLSVTKALDTLTISSYLSDLTQLEEQTQKPLTKLDTTEVLKFLSSFDNKRTLNRKLSSINAFFAFCHKQDFVHEKIKIPMAKVPKNLPKYVSNEEILDGINLIDRSTVMGLRDYALILFLYASGCRISEALSVQRADIVEGWLKIRFAKGEKERVVPLAPVATQALERYLAEQTMASAYLWLNYRGETPKYFLTILYAEMRLSCSPL